MNICLLSDTHNHLDEPVIHHLQWADEIWHAGDIGELKILEQMEDIAKVRAVWGNVDGHSVRIALKETVVFLTEAGKVMIHHIGGYPPQYTKETRDLLDKHRPDMLITGHSHILRIQRDASRNLLYVNPGAAGIHGFHTMRTLVRMQIRNGIFTDVQVVELGKRGSIRT